MGRVIPTKAEMEHERTLQIVATKGVVQLFNAVAEFQTSVVKEQIKTERDKKIARTSMIQSVGTDKNTGAVGFGNIIAKIQSKQRKWAVLEDEASGDEEIKLGELE